jgi:hypothetical protein
MAGDHVLQSLGFLQGERVLEAAPGTRQVDVLALGPAVVFGSRLQVGVRQDSDLFQHGQGPIHGRSIDARHPLADPSGNRRRIDVAV